MSHHYKYVTTILDPCILQCIPKFINFYWWIFLIRQMTKYRFIRVSNPTSNIQRCTINYLTYLHSKVICLLICLFKFSFVQFRQIGVFFNCFFLKCHYKNGHLGEATEINQVPILPKVTNIAHFTFFTFNQYSLVGQFFAIILRQFFRPLIK
jgi:hypothetical protein